MEIHRRETTRPTVLVAGGDGAESWVSEALPTATVETVVDRDRACDRATDGSIDCAVVAPADGEDVDAVADLREAAPGLPIVYAPARPDGAAAAEASAAGASAYLPRELAAEGDLAERVDALVDDYDRRRQARTEQGMLRELLGNAPLSIYFKDREARHLAVTSHTTAAFDETFVGRTDLELYADEIGEELARESLEDDRRVIETGEPVIGREERHVTPEGEELWLRTTKFPWRDEDGEIVGVIGTTEDVSEIKHRELELEREKRRLEQFASFASHDLRNPVGIAMGYLERAKAGEGDLADAHEAIGEALERMDRLIDDLLNMASPEAEREVGGWADLGAVAERAWDVAGDDEATLEVSVPEGTEIYADEGALRQLLENVLSNAVEHGSTSPRSHAREDALDHGGGSVAVEVGLTDVGFFVADDGPGIPEADRDAVFDYGYTTGGTGVGLAIAREIAEAHGWEARATESARGGARFEFDGVIRRPPPVSEVALAEPVSLEECTDVDGATPPGEAERVDDGWILRGGGDNLWGDLDEYLAVHGAATGDLRIEARVADLESVHEYSKAGVLVVEAAEAGRPLAFTGVTAAHGAETAWRSAPGELIDTRQFDAVADRPAYVRVDRLGDRLTCYVSADCEDWEVVDQAVVELSETVRVGLAVCSHNPERLCEARFEDVRVVGLETDDGGA